MKLSIAAIMTSRQHQRSGSVLAADPSKKTVCLIVSLIALLLGGEARLRAQPALDDFDPSAGNTIWAIALQPDGKIVIGGDFILLSPNGGTPVARNRIARLNPDGTVDMDFNPDANAAVHKIVLQADGKILVAGNFSTIGGQTRSTIARLDPATGAADSFNPQPTAGTGVDSIAVQADGKILLGGSFTGLGGVLRVRIARLHPNGDLDDSFTPFSDNVVNTIVVQPDGKILVGGNFISIGGKARHYVARLQSANGLADSFDPNANGFVETIALQADGKVLVGGSFNVFNGTNTIGGASRNRIARLDGATGLADDFNPNANNAVFSIAVQADGKVLAGGGFSGANSIGGQTRNRIARLDAATGLADSFDPNANTGTILAIALHPDGRILLGGGFNRLSPNGGAQVIRNRIARFGTPQPLLSIQRDASTNVLLQWATNFNGFTLEANSDFNGNIWSPASPSPAVIGTNNVVTNDASGAARFYRLSK